MTRRVVVVGGGISGLAAAWSLLGSGSAMEDPPEVTVLEAADRLGGALYSSPVGGHRVDLGPDGFLGRRPEALDLCHQIGLGDALVPIAGRGAGVWARGKVRPLPEGLALGIPTRFWPAATSGVLGLRGQFGLARDKFVPRPDVRGPIGDRSIGPLVGHKLGQRVVDALVDPLIGGIHAGSVDDMSAATTYPPLLAAAQRRGSLMRALRAEVPAPDPDAPPLFWALRDGMGSLIDQLAGALSERGATIHTNSAVQRLDRRGSGWVVSVDGALGEVAADAVVLAVPAPATARLLRPHDDEVAGLLRAIDYASVMLVSLRLRTESVPAPLIGTGFLVPRRSRRPGSDEGWAVTACTYLSEKWPHVADEGEVLLRASVGRYGDARAQHWSDDEVVQRVRQELQQLMGLQDDPLEVRVTHWPDAFPQYRVHHLLRTAGVESAVARLGGLAVAGAAYRGVGIPACIASGRAAAQALL
jgi:oxygen-dependent protoporphyrinogen oxidase